MTVTPSANGPETLRSLMEILGYDPTSDIFTSFSKLPPQTSLRLDVNVNISITSDELTEPLKDRVEVIQLGSIKLEPFEIQHCLHTLTPTTSAETGNREIFPSGISDSAATTSLPTAPPTPREDDGPPNKRRKTTGGLKVSKEKITAPLPIEASTTRQLQPKPRGFPLRKKKDDYVHQLQPVSIGKFTNGIWKQIYSSIELGSSPDPDSIELSALATGGSDIDTFRAVNSLCLRVTKMGRSFRALETIVQAHWVDRYEARVKSLAAGKLFLSNTETRMTALREACTVLQWSEKELRNKLAIWRGYKEIKDAGGWVALAFAGSGIYRFCKYRVGFGKAFSTRLGRLQPSLEVAADTIHPEWRKLLQIIGQESANVYRGHPHDWVVSDNAKPVSLASTYLQWFPYFDFRQIEESQLDEAAWGTEDPRRVPGTMICGECGYLQSAVVATNECRCFPELHGGCKAPSPVQVIRAAQGKNNGLVARCEFARGSAISEFVGLITKGIDGIDVMQSGIGEKQYQIYQGKMGNYTRFINHSCAPNSQFQKFCWLGSERIILVSKGIAAGTEITVDYSNDYWDGLDKECLCGEACCRYWKRGGDI